jgi:ER-bound oxygenase mpaB/B'/Rubber oxygenase, catalytic domain
MVYFQRYDRLHRIQELNPIQDHWEIYRLMLGYEFPWDITRALEVALMKTYCIPSISKLLDKTGEFYKRSQKRYDDTSIILVEIIKWGYDSARGLEAIEKMNAIHGRFRISNEDFLYVLSTFIYEPIRWNQCFGWRKMCEHERLANFYFWQEVGKRMHIKDIPESYEELERYNLEYEQNNFIYSQTNQRIGEATSELFLSWFPQWMHFAIAPAIPALFDEKMLDAFGFKKPPQWIRLLTSISLKIKGKLLYLLPPSTKSDFFIDSPIRSYPDGYNIADVGAKDN